MWILRFRLLDCLHLINLFLLLFDVSIKSHKSFWLTSNIRNLGSGLDALVANVNFKGSRKRCNWGGLIDGKIKDSDSPKWINNDSFRYFTIFKFIFLHNFWLCIASCIVCSVFFHRSIHNWHVFCFRPTVGVSGLGSNVGPLVTQSHVVVASESVFFSKCQGNEI